MSSSGLLQNYPNSLEEPIAIPIGNRLSARLYADSRPHYLETASIQKGLVLMIGNKELIEEGVGFGVPVVKYTDKTYFSSSASVAHIRTEGSALKFEKTFVLDTVSRKRFWRTGYINDELYSHLHKSFERLYLSHENLSTYFNKMMEFREATKIKTEFEKVKPKGWVTVSYELQFSKLSVSVDFTKLDLDDCIELLILNEQGSKFFAKYADSSGLKLIGNKIGAWHPVQANQATLMNQNEQIKFSLRKASSSSLFRGWEQTKNRFSWAGLSYSLQPSNREFDYTIELTLNG